ncbi:variable membrane protein precursor [Reticulomyxa filosa]|uniref:Variable membrane protein n=1 Tax=Reticulomyxa filosa TaxID=46433 RepID=X6P2L8_RETFI|nr:variable membrane protein precursor [Reticulomyxa filosa]|eukprot:ETO32805.1 variable membrane protein precursor [Reticulomyxa filosa]
MRNKNQLALSNEKADRNIFCQLRKSNVRERIYKLHKYLSKGCNIDKQTNEEDPGKAEIRDFLRILRQQYVDKVLEQLFDVLGCDDMESVVVLPNEKWRNVFKKAELVEGQQSKLLRALNEWRQKKDMKPLDVDGFMRGDTEKLQSEKPVETNLESSKASTKEKPENGNEIPSKDDEKAKESTPRQVEAEKQIIPKDENKNDSTQNNTNSATNEDAKNEPKPVEKKVEYGKVASVNLTSKVVTFNLKVTLITLYIFIYLLVVTLFFFMLFQNNQKANAPLEDKQWGHLQLKQGDEIQCTYTLNENKKLVVENIEWPVYEGHIGCANKVFLVSIKPHSDTRQVTCFDDYVTQTVISVTFSSNIVPGVTKLRDGDKLSFRLRFEKQYIPVDVKRIEKALIRKIKDIPASSELEEKASNFCDVKKWLEDPSQRIFFFVEQPSWKQWQNKELSKMGSTLMKLLQEGEDSHVRESKMEQVMWQKRAIQLELAKGIIMQCICEPCQVPDSLLCALPPSRQSQDVNEGKHDEEVNPANSGEQNEEIVKLLKLVEEFHEMTEDDNCQHLLEKCVDIVLEEKIIDCNTLPDFIIPNECTNDNASKIVRIYAYHEILSTDKRPIISLKKGIFFIFRLYLFRVTPKKILGQGYSMRVASTEFTSLCVADFRIKKNTSLVVDVKYQNLRVSVNVDHHKCAYFVALKSQGYAQPLYDAIHFLKKATDSSSQFPNVFVARHLMESIHDEESFQFARQAMRDMAKEFQKPTKELQSLFQKITNSLNKHKGDIKLKFFKKKKIYQIIFVCEQLGEQRQYLFPPQLFAVVKCAITTLNIIETMKDIFWFDLKCNICEDKTCTKVEGFQQFMLIPCFNLLTSKSNMQNDKILRCFDFKNVNKVSQMATRCIDVVETDLKIRRLLSISSNLCAEVHLMQILHLQNDNYLSQEVLKHLLSNDEFMTVQTWTNLWTSYDSKCADVIFNLHKCNFEKWSQFVERLQTIQALKDEQIRKKLLGIFDHRNFQHAVVLTDEAFIDFISFILKHKDTIWENWENVLQTLDYYIDKTGIIYRVDTLMVIFGVLWKYCSFDQKAIERQVSDASEKLLKRFVSEGKPLTLWLKLFTYETQEERKHIFKNILSKSLSDWINNKMVGRNIDSPQQLVDLMFHPEFWSLPSEYQNTFLTEITEKKETILLSGKKWSNKSLEAMKKLLGTKSISVDLKLLNKIFEAIVDIPVQVEPIVNKEDANKDKDTTEEKKENQDKENENNEEKKQEVPKEEKVDKDKPKLLIYYLEYCFLSIPWLPLIQHESTKVERLKDLQTFMEMALNNLFTMSEDKSIAFCVCEFLERDNNKNNIQLISKSLPRWKDNNIQNRVNALLDVLKKYKEFVRLKQLYTVVSTNYMIPDDLSERLQEFGNFCANWDLEPFLKACQSYQNEQKMFQKREKIMNDLADIKNSFAFKKLWNMYRADMKEQGKLTFETSMDELYTQVNKKWMGLGERIKKESFSMGDLNWFEASDLHLELKFLFPKWHPQTSEAMAKGIHEKCEKIKQLREMVTPWAKLIDATEILKEYHKSNHTIKNDKNWNTFIQSLENGLKALKEREPSIQHLSKCYDECISCFGNEALQCVELLDLIVNKKELIKQLATNENFANKEHFANTMETLDNCKEIRFQQLVGALRAVNGNIREYIWDTDLKVTSQVAKAILAIHKRDNDFTVKFKKCCDEDLSRVSFLVEEAGRLQAVQSFNLLEKANQIGQWHFAGCDQVLQVSSIVIDNSKEKQKQMSGSSCKLDQRNSTTTKLNRLLIVYC